MVDNFWPVKRWREGEVLWSESAPRLEAHVATTDASLIGCRGWLGHERIPITYISPVEADNWKLASVPLHRAHVGPRGSYSCEMPLDFRIYTRHGEVAEIRCFNPTSRPLAFRMIRAREVDVEVAADAGLEWAFALQCDGYDEPIIFGNPLLFDGEVIDGQLVPRRSLQIPGEVGSPRPKSIPLSVSRRG